MVELLKKILVHKTDNLFVQFFRYFWVGGVATIFDIVPLYLLVEYVHIHYLLAACLTFILGTAVNYILSVAWVFKRNGLAHHVNFILFGAIGLIGLGLNLLIIWALVDKTGLWYMYAKFISTILVLFWNFSARRFVVMKF